MDEITVINKRNNDNTKDDYDDEDDNKTLKAVIEIFELKREFHPNYIPPLILLQPRLRSKHISTCLF